MFRRLAVIACVTSIALSGAAAADASASKCTIRMSFHNAASATAKLKKISSKISGGFGTYKAQWDGGTLITTGATATMTITTDFSCAHSHDYRIEYSARAGTSAVSSRVSVQKDTVSRAISWELT